MIYYLATPYSKYPHGLHAAYVGACQLAAKLLQLDYKIYSPIAHTHPIAIHGGLDPLDHNIWLPFDHAIMEHCDALIIAHMDGWQDSYGIAQEIKYFAAHNKDIYDLDPSTLELTLRPWPVAA